MHHTMDPKRFFLAKGIERGYREWFARELQKSDTILLVAVQTPQENEPIAYCYGRIEERDWNLLLDRHAALHDIFVSPDARRCSAASLLVEAFIARATTLGAPRIVLSTAHSNQKAQLLFEKLGFRPTMIEMTRELEP